MSGLPERASNLIGGVLEPSSGDATAVTSPWTGEPIGSVGGGDAATVDRAVAAARAALPGWSSTPSTRRARVLTRLAGLIEANATELAATISLDNGKTLADARAELERAREHLEAAATAPALLAGEHVVDVVSGIDATLVREPIGVAAIVAPFNFPIMTGLIYWSWALACGNTVVIKPSEQAPYGGSALGRLFREAGFPDGVVNIVQGGRVTVEALCDHPDVASVSLVGSSATAAAVYARASAAGKRAQAAGGARNPLVALPDADPDVVATAVTTSAFGMSGQRCLSSSILVTVGDQPALLDAVVRTARESTVAPSPDAAGLPPMISQAAVDAVTGVLTRAGEDVLVDGRSALTPGKGYLIGPSVVRAAESSPLMTDEIFGPVLFVVAVPTLDAALAFVNASPFGNAASIYTTDGAAARTFTSRADVGNIGVNVGVAAPTAQVGFGGRRRSFLGTIHSQGRTAVDFFTDLKSVSARWVS
ncbi:malonate-semialdehyde dehydrogenase (acetylating)/methylmalonate-semialdehyde dehydrogenase [Actinoplanes lutulentus]|uniref:Malonate-semialdehyde dehydrogenase (Acetylating)/methylmalonate-semialdehyde dehydrogenase n=1 Tax=Actinoplanes lutulentus TaxID=1287878 RepID=A0A327YYB6_9ACTN|nr:aldehyde dehydrogenase family protein [Actinoplanes lutulentus]MBB2946501.1 malonate-semialdehyde dehydrogenase (acetylating)/methylmalonate-semialdehyde dehydrogenase [Actinoplanes lutulentus]RAK26419.1 malonate-semialdehyde dehydrogenase (acetylating)/methylmalonate-semialdehyde dehydrogenase [Actinoplanes lutulentus]